MRKAATNPRRYRIGLKFLLVTVVLAALLLAWFTHEYRKAQRQTALVAELSTVGVLSILDEPTGLSLFVGWFNRKYEQALRTRIASGWLDRPTVFLCTRLREEEIPFAAIRLKSLGTVREIHTEGTNLTDSAVAKLRRELPDVNIVPSANPALHQYFRDQVEHEHLATDGMKFAGVLILGIIGTIVFFAWPLLRRQSMTR